jgi:tetratricopeptide (TPR) repeat protein
MSLERYRQRPRAALVLGAMAGAHASLGQYGKAEAACRQAIDELREEGRDVDVARIRINLGNMLIRMGRRVEALEQYTLAE